MKKTWKVCWLLLQGQYLYLFKAKPKEKDSQVPIHIFNLKKSSVEKSGEAYKLFTFKVTEQSKSSAIPEINFIFGCRTKEDHFSWMELIRSNCDTVKPDQPPLLEEVVKTVVVEYKPDIGYTVKN